MSIDENDRLIAGTLPVDPKADAKPVNGAAKRAAEDTPRILTVQQILCDAGTRAMTRSGVRSYTTGVHKIDDATGGLQPGFVWVFGADTSWGKCLGGDTSVMRSDGSAALARDINPGDELMGPDSKPRTVLTTTHGNGPMYRIVPMRGEPWLCNWAHILVVVSTRTGVVTEISVEDFLKKSPTWRHQQKLFHVAVDYPQQEAPAVDPWFLGIWYGDGTKDLVTASITTPDPEVVDGIRATASAWGLSVREDRKPDNLAATYSLTCTRQQAGGAGNALVRQLRAVYGNGESLPESCVRGSRQVRLEFLSGLFDSDGYRKTDHHCEIVTRHRKWAEQIVLLCRSLGFQAVIYEKTNVSGYEDRIYWRIQVSGNLSCVPTRIARKRFPDSEPRTDVTRAGFTIEPAGDGDYFGWQLDGDGLFLLADCTVTHNSSILVMIADENIKLGKRVLIVSGEDSEKIYGDRLLIRRARVDAMRFKRKTLDRDEQRQITNVIAKAESVPVYLDAIGKSVEWISRHTSKIIRDEGIDVVAFDYLQAFDNDKRQQDRRNEVKYIARTLTDVAKTADVAGIIFSQITVQPGKTHPDKHSIRESRDVSNAAEVVALGFTPEKDIISRTGEVKVEAGCKAVFLDKVKDGPRGDVIAMKWDTACACFDRIADPEAERIAGIVGDMSDMDYIPDYVEN